MSSDSSVCRILVVDDNVDTANSFAMLLRMEGHDVQVAHGGPAALESARASRPDLVLLDLGMPGMDGFEVARRLRQEFSGPLTLIALTGWGEEDFQHQSAEAGFDHWLLKPVKSEALRIIISDSAAAQRRS